MTIVCDSHNCQKFQFWLFSYANVLGLMLHVNQKPAIPQDMCKTLFLLSVVVACNIILVTYRTWVGRAWGRVQWFDDMILKLEWTWKYSCWIWTNRACLVFYMYVYLACVAPNSCALWMLALTAVTNHNMIVHTERCLNCSLLVNGWFESLQSMLSLFKWLNSQSFMLELE